MVDREDYIVEPRIIESDKHNGVSDSTVEATSTMGFEIGSEYLYHGNVVDEEVFEYNSSASERRVAGGIPMVSKALILVKSQERDETWDNKKLSPSIDGWTTGFCKANVATG